ncbi:WD40/YVTN/BNR-like repeat-containing protein [Ferruginibacter yonginensis]|uniref:WD40/YVTN/BNR-like repeat-containing protein n=1 Tax=Ferruginibacter yonginensis TaxID=1310416 RepID=A0ABV8QMN2_9BACT
MRILLALLLLLTTFLGSAQSIQILNSGTKSSLRGLSAINDQIIWVSGSNGTVGKSLDGGITWRWFVVKDFEKAEFRDIEAFDENTAIIIAIASPAYILKTTDGGETWKQVYKNAQKDMFLDAIDFYDANNGIVVGDPIDGKLFLAKTIDGGNTWKDISTTIKAKPDSGEAFFASSGTNIKLINKKKFHFVSGGKASKYYNSNGAVTVLPLLQGQESTGANSFATNGKKFIAVVGGDFNKKNDRIQNCIFSTDAGKTWKVPTVLPFGYRSCIDYISNSTWITCGLNGVDITSNNLSSFTHISDEGFHVCKRSKYGSVVFLAGNNGKVARLILN